MTKPFLGTVGLIIPTYNAGGGWRECLDRLNSQSLAVSCVLVVDSSSTDETVALASAYALSVKTIDKALFNHGGTRQLALSCIDDVDVVVLLTQDTLLADEHSLANIVAPFNDLAVAAVCGRQLPHLNANPIAAHARIFNYQADSEIKSLGDADRLGLKAAFISNSFAAYRVSALNEVGGFPSDVIVAEDMYVAARMLSKGWKIAYAGNAVCYHSHNYTPWKEFKRYFDTGVFHSRESWIREMLGGAGGEGVRYVLSELKYLGLKKIHWWPRSLLSNVLKLMGYKLGLAEGYLSVALKRRLSMHKGFWNEPH